MLRTPPLFGYFQSVHFVLLFGNLIREFYSTLFLKCLDNPLLYRASQKSCMCTGKLFAKYYAPYFGLSNFFQISVFVCFSEFLIMQFFRDALHHVATI